MTDEKNHLKQSELINRAIALLTYATTALLAFCAMSA